MRRLVPSHLYGDYPAQLELLTDRSGDCWTFNGFVNQNSYGQLGRNLPAHRVAWEAHHGRPIPVGLVIDHTCHNADRACNANSECLHRRCVNPNHLEAVTAQTNILRGKSPLSPVNILKTRCDHGHAFTTENTYYRPDRFGRICIACRDEALRRGRHKWADANRDRAAAKRREDNPLTYEIREWATANGLSCSMSGPISAAVRSAYYVARQEAS